MLKAYKYRIYPNQEQAILLHKHFGCARWLYNHALNRKIEEYTANKKHLSRFDLQGELPGLKADEKTSWLKEVNSQSLQVVLKNLDAAFTRFFKEKKGFPRFKSKKTNKFSFQVPQNIEVAFKDKKIFFPKFKEGMYTVFDREFQGEIRQATISRVPSGKYFISVLVENGKEHKKAPKPKIEKSLGIDLGIKDFIVLSDGVKVGNPKHLKKSLKKLKREQRWHSRKVKGSANREKQRVVVAKQHEYIANQRMDFLQKLSTNLVCKNQATTFCMEDLSVKNMMKNHNLAQAISDVSWHKFVELMKYKCQWYGKNLLFIGRFEASSKTCSCCGLIKKDLTLADRNWTCQGCKTTHDRDINAAINIQSFAFHSKNKSETKEKIKIGQELPELTSVEKGVPRKSSPSLKQKS